MYLFRNQNGNNSLFKFTFIIFVFSAYNAVSIGFSTIDGWNRNIVEGPADVGETMNHEVKNK